MCMLLQHNSAGAKEYVLPGDIGSSPFNKCSGSGGTYTCTSNVDVGKGNTLDLSSDVTLNIDGEFKVGDDTSVSNEGYVFNVNATKLHIDGAASMVFNNLTATGDVHIHKEANLTANVTSTGGEIKIDGGNNTINGDITANSGDLNIDSGSTVNGTCSPSNSQCTPLPSMDNPTVVSQTTYGFSVIISGTYSSSVATSFNVTVNSVTYVLSSSSELSNSSDNWTLDLSNITPLPLGTYQVVATSTDADGSLSDTSSNELVITEYSADWWDTNWTKCRNITIANTGTATLSNFPAYIDLAYDSDMQSTYNDIRFINTSCANGGFELDFEIETYTAASADVWVEIDNLPTAGTTIAVYYGNASATSGENINGTWNSSHKGVWHLSENTSATNQDSTSNSNNGTPQNSPVSTSGKIGKALDFDVGDETRIDLGTDDSLDLSTGNSPDWTISLWVKPFSDFGDRSYPLMYQYGSYGASVGLDKDNGKIEHWRNDDTALYNNTDLNINAWNHVVVTRDNSLTRLYLNGNANGSGNSVAINETNFGSYIGGYPDYPNGDLEGLIDEVRVSNVARTPDWIKQSYDLVQDQNDHVTIGDEVEPEPDPELGQCSAIFPDGASTHSVGGTISFGYNSQLFGSDDNQLATTAVSENSGSNVNTCDTADCVATGTASNAASTITFQTTSSPVDVPVGPDGAVVVGSGSFCGTEFNDINPGYASRASITFSATPSHCDPDELATPNEYWVDTLVLGSENTLYLQAGGTYWINQLTMGSQADIIVQGSGTALIYVNQSLTFPSPGLINSPSDNNTGDASKLVMYVLSDVTFNNQSTYTGSLYVEGNLILGSSSHAFGAISAADIRLDSQSTITYQRDEVKETHFGSLCVVPQINACGMLNAVGIKIDDSGNNTQINTTTEALAIHAAWLSAGSPVSGAIAGGTYNVAASGTSNINRIDFGGYSQDFADTLPYPGADTGVGDEDFLVRASGTLSLPAGDYTIYVESDDGFNFVMNTLNGDTVSFSKFGNSSSGASNELRYENPTGNSNTGGSFTLTQDSVFDISAIFFERDGGDYLEISISNDIRANEAPSGYEILRHGALNEKVKFGQCIPSLEIQAGRAILKNTANSPEFTSVCFDTPFSEVPRVFSLPTTDDDDDRLALRIRNVTTTGFDIAQVEPPRITSLDSPAGNVSQTVDFLAIPEGDYHLDDAAMMRVGSVSTKAFQGDQAGGSQSWVTISTADLAFSQTPAIIASIQTMNNETNPFPISIPFLATTVSSVGNTNFNIALERGETNGDYLDNNETIGFLAITPGSGELTNDISYESFLTDNSITGINSCQVSNLNTYNSNPLVIASQNTRNGSNGGWLKRCSITPSSVGFTIVEDQAFDAEGSHISERAGGIALGGTFTDMTCNTQNVHHYRIEHDEQGFTCEAETVTIKACADANCESLYDQDTTITLSDLGLAGDGWSNGNEITIPASTAMSITLSVTEDTEDGSVIFSKTSANPNASLRCFSGSTETCEMTFSNDGFEFFGASTAIKTLTDQAAETDFSDVNIRAVRNDAGVCKPLLNGPQDISFTYNCEDPATCLTPLAGIELNSAPGDDQSGTLRVTFANNGTAPLSMLNYADVGRLNLTVSAQVKNVTVTSGKATVDVYPDELRVNVQPPSDVSNTASTYVAGAIFDLTIGAYGIQGRKLPNYQPGDLQMLLQRITPDAASTIEGILTLDNTPHTTALTPGYQSTTIPIFDAGKYSYTANYDEVGKIQINFKDGDYLGNSIDSAGPLNLGRFIPAYFKITQITDPSLNNTRDGSSYIGEYIPFSTSLVYQITAKNASGQTTSNYGGDHWKLSFNASHVSFADNTMNSGEILGDISSNGTESDYDGKATYSITQPASTEFAIYTSPLARIPKTHIPINPIDMSFTPVITTVAANAASSVIRTIADSDGVCFKHVYSSACQVFDSEVIQGAQARYGRLVIESTYGPDQEDLSVPIKAEYFTNNQWLINQDDNSTSVAFDLSAGQLLLSGEASLKNSVGNVSSNGGLLGGKSVGHQLKFSAPHVSGELLLELVPNATGTIWSNYLNYDWNNNLSISQDDKPSATVTFGQFRGNDKIIHWREVFN
jgi:cytoskeletal protein CcmA (bactofilin family)